MHLFKPKPPKIRTVTVAVRKPSTSETKSADKNQERKSGDDKLLKPSTSAPTSRYNLTPSTKPASRTPSKAAEDRRSSSSLSVRNPQRKRKAATPSTPQWASSSSESESEEPEFRKRQKMSSSIEPLADFRRCLEPDLNRRIQYEDPASRQPGDAESEEKDKLIHGYDMCVGKLAKDFKPAFKKEKPPAGSTAGDSNNSKDSGSAQQQQQERVLVKLQYPSLQPPERFELLIPRDPTNWDPLKDIEYTIEEIIQNYLPPDLIPDLLSESEGTVRLLKRAVAKNSPDAYRQTLKSFNRLIRTNLENGTISSVMSGMTSIPLSLTKRILAQVYSRTVSPHAHLLRRVKEKATTYGELLPPFIHNIFHQTSLTSSSVFVDLGSGVGNVVLQSALQTGAESWGIEIMDTPASFALKQASELRARARMWNIRLGPIHLIHGDIFDNAQIDEVLRRADVVLVNNKVFPQALNGRLLDKFLDLKQGARVVSLESFTPPSRQGVRNEQNVAMLFEEERFESGTQSVSWAGESVDYFIARKVR